MEPWEEMGSSFLGFLSDSFVFSFFSLVMSLSFLVFLSLK